MVIVDSLKDAAVRLSEDAVGAQWNRARQHLLAQGCQVLELHHSTKRGPAGAPISGVADIYGSTWLTSGCGSIILLTGEPGDPIVSFRHVKQPGVAPPSSLTRATTPKIAKATTTAHNRPMPAITQTERHGRDNATVAGSSRDHACAGSATVAGGTSSVSPPAAPSAPHAAVPSASFGLAMALTVTPAHNTARQ